MKCDFCSADPATVAYRTIDHVLLRTPGVEQISTQGWAACADCAALIDAGDAEAVIDRSVDRLRSVNPTWRSLSRAAARSLIAEMQGRFFALLAIGEIQREALPDEPD